MSEPEIESKLIGSYLDEVDRLRASVPALKSEVERLKVELVAMRHDLTESNRQRDESQAAAAVMREALESALDGVWDGCYGRGVAIEYAQSIDKKVKAALSPTAGTAFLARMAEAEWLLNVAIGPAFGEKSECQDWYNRRDAFLKGDGVKA